MPFAHISKAILLVLMFFCFSQSIRAETFLFGAAACPPWKAIPKKPELTAKMAKACELDLNMFVDSFSKAFQVSEKNITALLDEKATFSGVQAAITDLAKKVGENDRVILYVNIHGGKVEALYKGYPAEDEIFAWYTEKKPTNMASASKDKWMTVRAFRDLVNTIMAKEIIIIIEACHAASGLHDFEDNYGNGLGHRGKDWPGREAIIYSSHEDQVANFTPDGTRALFTEKFANILKTGTFKTLGSAYRSARTATHMATLKHCKEGSTHKELINDWSEYREFCTQMPTSWDPFGLLEDIPLQTPKYQSSTSTKQ